MVFVSVTDFLVLHIINNAHYFLVNLYSSTVCTRRRDFILRSFIISVATFLVRQCSAGEMHKLGKLISLGQSVFVKLGGDEMEKYTRLWRVSSEFPSLC